MPTAGVNWTRRLPGAVLLLACCCCSAVVTRQTYQRGPVAFRVGLLPADWQQVHVHDAQLVFRHRGGGTMAASGWCPAGEDVPLTVLTNHLLFGMTAQKVREQTPVTLAGRQALRTQLLVELDGVPVELGLVVLKKDGCVYDLQLIATPREFAGLQRDFDTFVRGFASATGT